jgi:hypothetical protein
MIISMRLHLALAAVVLLSIRAAALSDAPAGGSVAKAAAAEPTQTPFRVICRGADDKITEMKVKLEEVRPRMARKSDCPPINSVVRIPSDADQRSEAMAIAIDRRADGTSLDEYQKVGI